MYLRESKFKGTNLQQRFELAYFMDKLPVEKVKLSNQSKVFTDTRS